MQFRNDLHSDNYGMFLVWVFESTSFPLNRETWRPYFDNQPQMHKIYSSRHKINPSRNKNNSQRLKSETQRQKLSFWALKKKIPDTHHQIPEAQIVLKTLK